MRELEKKFNVSTNSVRTELNQLTKSNLLKPRKNGRQAFYMVNQEHQLLLPKLDGRPRVLIWEAKKKDQEWGELFLWFRARSRVAK